MEDKTYLQERGSDKMNIKVYSTDIIKREVLKLSGSMLPLFSSLVGNDYTDEVCREVTNYLGVSINKNDPPTQYIDDVLNMLSKYSSYRSVVQKINERVPARISKPFNEGLALTKTTMNPETAEPPLQMYVDEDEYYCGRTIHDIGSHYQIKGIVIYPEILCGPERNTVFIYTKPIRALIYGFHCFDDFTPVIEYVHVHKELLQGECVPTETIGMRLLSKYSDIDKMKYILQCLDIADPRLLEMWQKVLNTEDEWYAKLITLLFYIKRYGDWTDEELLHVFHTFIQVNDVYTETDVC